MKKIIGFIFICLPWLNLNSQNLISLGSFPVQDSGNKSIRTSDLLEKIDWRSIKNYNGSTHHVREDSSNFLKTYEYIKLGYTSYLRISSFDGLVMQFESEISTTYHNSKSSYFDKAVWLAYARKVMPDLQAEFIITHEEPQEVLRAYYRLLGLQTSDEYGWMCEYASHGRPTDRRLAVLKLIDWQRRDLLKKILSYPNTQTQLYAADALIFLDYETRNRITKEKTSIELNEKSIDSLESLPGDHNDKIASLRGSIKYNKDLIKRLKNDLLKDKDWKKIYDLRDSNKPVKTCRDGTGSYRIYPGTTSELLSKQAISEIPLKYQKGKEYQYW